jgi:uncharacterized protein YggU (UPF0235/DUF167 family)
MYIKVKVLADAKEEKFEKISDDHFEVSVREKAERNMANDRIVELFRKHFGLEGRKGIVKIISGHHSPSKIISIEKTD